MNIIFLLTTALVVSLDSLICGFTLSYKFTKKLPILIGICSVVTLLCLLTTFLGFLLKDILSEKIANFGGVILVAVGVYNIFSNKRTGDTPPNTGIVKQSILLGFGIGLDGACANLSLNIMGYNSFVVPLTIIGMHVALITFGMFLANTKFLRIFRKYNFIPPIILIALGVYKLICAFI